MKHTYTVHTVLRKRGSPFLHNSYKKKLSYHRENSASAMHFVVAINPSATHIYTYNVYIYHSHHLVNNNYSSNNLDLTWILKMKHSILVWYPFSREPHKYLHKNPHKYLPETRVHGLHFCHWYFYQWCKQDFFVKTKTKTFIFTALCAFINDRQWNTHEWICTFTTQVTW